MSRLWTPDNRLAIPRLAMVRDGMAVCCCYCGTCAHCSGCAPEEMALTIAGAVADGCTDCADINGTWYLQWTSVADVGTMLTSGTCANNLFSGPPPDACYWTCTATLSNNCKFVAVLSLDDETNPYKRLRLYMAVCPPIGALGRNTWGSYVDLEEPVDCLAFSDLALTPGSYNLANRCDLSAVTASVSAV